MASEEIKLTKTVRSEALSAQVSGTVRSSCYELPIKETVAIFPLLFSVHKNAWIYFWITCIRTSLVFGSTLRHKQSLAGQLSRCQSPWALNSWPSSWVSTWHLVTLLGSLPSHWIVSFFMPQVQEAMQLESRSDYESQTHKPSKK